ncbi:DNA methyltransferase [Hymenobacter humi]|uniref:DNA methyltransferase n=1 Tax=Hymenobacter humi TaxID=1411620 RepID=A0ABW2UEC5_9BACT
MKVLDPACGSGNFLYVTLEHLKRLEGEVLTSLAKLGGSGRLDLGEGTTVSPRQLLGLELNPAPRPLPTWYCASGTCNGTCGPTASRS